MEQVVTALRALGERTRLRIVALLARGELTVSELVQVLGQSQPRVSRHLKLLTEAGLVERLPEGAWVFYRLADHQGPLGTLVQSVIGAVPGEDVVRRRDDHRLGDVRRARAQAAEMYFGQVASDWDTIRALHSPDDDVEQAMLAAMSVSAPEVLVDIGTGTGRVLKLFSPHVRRAIGVDLSHEMLTVARANLEQWTLGNASVRHGDLYALPVAPGSADLVVVHQVLHYLDDPARALGEAAAALRPGGQLMVVDFAPHDLEFLREACAHRRLGFDDAEIASWLRHSGLKVGGCVSLGSNRNGEVGDERKYGGEGLTVKIWTAHRDEALGVAAKGDAA